MWLEGRRSAGARGDVRSERGRDKGALSAPVRISWFILSAVGAVDGLRQRDWGSELN